ncbi:MAG: ABC transporter ATP-binding protein [Gemmatimonadota bacterium]
MSDVALRLENVGKRYRLGEMNRHRTLREALTLAAQGPLRRVKARMRGEATPPAGQETFWALRDVSFELERGEVLGVIGRNGAGKSTLLKLLARITEPTEGRISGYGRVGSLLEVGTGFHPELTGRENIFLNGAILGMRRAEITSKFDEIVHFSEIERFLNTPVKRYSSGMYTRLAFAVAAHLEPEILLVDEVLAVGDLAFQKKCLGKMQDVAQEGRTVLFVSHHMSMIRTLCPKTVWIDQGRLKALGETARVAYDYQEATVESGTVPLAERPDRTGDQSVRLRSLRIRPVEGGSVISITSRLRVEIEYESDRPLRQPRFYLDVCDVRGTGIYALDSDCTGSIPHMLPARGKVVCETDYMNVTPGRCYVNLAVFKGGMLSDRVDAAATFDVESANFYPTGVMHEREWTMGVIEQRWYPLDEG